jgi:hypothetical protein
VIPPETARRALVDRVRATPPSRWAMAAALAGLVVAGVGGWLAIARPPASGAADAGPSPATTAAVSSDIARPSFKCADAGSQTERYICAEPAVAAAELEMSNAYGAAMARAADKATLMSSQRDFLINLTAAPHNRQTFIRLYKARTAALKALADRN